LTAIQRARILAGACEAIETVGYARMTVAEIISRARVSRKTFYDAFADRDDCFLALLEETLDRAAFLARRAYLDKQHWRAGVRSALCTLLVLMESEPTLARLWVVEALRGDERVLERRARVLDGLAQVIGEGSHANSSGGDPPGVVDEAVVGGVIAVLHSRLLRATEEPLTDLLGPLMYMIVLPYLGENVARSELTNPTPHVAPDNTARSPLRSNDPLGGLKIRLTYRTVRVLVAVGELTGASNREVANASGIVDQGQISKLLSRLARLELIENHGLGQEKGAPNAWQLTQRGQKVVRAVRSRVHTTA